MRRRQSKLRMVLRGRSGVLACLLFGVSVLLAIYYAWNNYFISPPSKISYSSVQGLRPGHMEQWDRERQQGFVIEEPPIGLNKEIEMQLANEKWKKAKVLEDRIDEERVIEEQAAQNRGKNVDNILRAKQDQKKGGTEDAKSSDSLLFQQGYSFDGDYFSKLERVVHLDLKGAPPVVTYLEKLFPILKTMGATGLLMEYEDMFPYSGNLSMLASGNAYSLADLQRIQAAAKASGLEIIPLVQTFGHMEFVLKYKDFLDLREHAYTPQVITPVRKESYTLIFNILKQVLEAHPDSRRIHLGCDEVYQLGEGQSNTYITSQNIKPHQLFLQHVDRVARHVRATYPKFQSLIWDDWLRSIPYDVLADSDLPGLVEPVVWYYQHNILDRVPSSVWDIYGKLFPGVWVASAFKGATGSAQIITNASVHLDNNLQWVSIIRNFGIRTKKVTFRGAVLTGWQRYDHFATLCELLPVGLPSLSLSMQALKSGAFGSKEMKTASGLLNCSRNLDLGFPAMNKDGAVVTQDCNFPGSEVYYSVQQLWGIMEVYNQDRGLHQRISGWMTDYQVRRGISNPGQMRVLAYKLHKVISRLQDLINPLRGSLLRIYDISTINEWISTNLQDQMSHLNDLYYKAKAFQEHKSWPARPFPDPSVAGGQVGGQRAPVKTGGTQSKNLPEPLASGGHYVKQRPVGYQKTLTVNNIAHESHKAPEGPQSINGRVQVNPVIRNNQHVYTEQNNGRMQQQQNARNISGLVTQRGGILSQTLLKHKADQKEQGRPSGPGKMQNYDQNAFKPDPPNKLQRQQSVNFQVVPSVKNQQELGMRGVLQGQKQPGPMQYVRGLPLNQQGFGANQYGRPQNQGLPQIVQGQQQNQGPLKNLPGLGQHQQDQGLHGLGQNSQRQQQNQPKGPPKVESRPLSLQEMPPVKDRINEKMRDEDQPEPDVNNRKQLNEEQMHGPLLKTREELPDRDNEHPDNQDENEDEGARYLLNSFVGQRGKGENDANHIHGNVEAHPHDVDNKRKADTSYDAEDDDAM